MLRNTGGSRGQTRSSALWGTGNRGGESRSSALWGKGGRGMVTMVAAAFLLCVPLVASAGSGSGSHGENGSFVAPALLREARETPNKLVRVIIQSERGTSHAKQAFDLVDSMDSSADREDLRQRLSLVDGVAVNLEADKFAALSHIAGLTVTPDAPVKLDGRVSSKQLWPYAQGFVPLWARSKHAARPGPAIAIVDSGIDSTRADFDGRVIADVNLSTLPNNSPRDGRGHGTMVAGLAAGSARDYAGGAPNAKIVSLDIMDDNGMARTSDVINAAAWILANKKTYNIRVANFSLHSATPSNFTRDPLDRAVEQLWFNNVFVVAAAGNYGTGTGPTGVRFAPGNDPFILTVGGTDLNGTLRTSDDRVADWSAYGYTYDGFWKPEISASGRYITGPVPTTSTLAKERPDHVKKRGYMQLSGTSFSTPIVAAAAAQILTYRPNLQPDDVKGLLMATAEGLPLDTEYATGVGQVNALRGVLKAVFPNPNRALNRYLTTSSGGGSKSFDAVAWQDAAKASIAWDDVAWSDVAWSDVAWNDVAWADIAWGDVAWQDVAWADIAWGDVAWNDAAAADGTVTSAEQEPTPDELQDDEQGHSAALAAPGRSLP
ncbi:MAG: S8 family serine peptidase [Actinomycetota bacterium]|nr:S8 family serine peptidase [Actinomycetota bacterium]